MSLVESVQPACRDTMEPETAADACCVREDTSPKCHPRCARSVPQDLLQQWRASRGPAIVLRVPQGSTPVTPTKVVPGARWGITRLMKEPQYVMHAPPALSAVPLAPQRARNAGQDIPELPLPQAPCACPALQEQRASGGGHASTVQLAHFQQATPLPHALCAL